VAVKDKSDLAEMDGALADGNRMTEAYDRIKRAILECDLMPGSRLSQVKIADILGLSRTPVREALRLLEKEGLITSERGRQIVISQTTMQDLDELYALRIKLDSATAHFCVPNLSSDDIQEMRECLDRMNSHSTAEDFAIFDEAHRTFHMIAIRGAGQRHVDFSAQLNEHAERYRRIYMGQANSFTQSRTEHEAILDACAEGDGDGVACLLAEHFARIALTIVAQIEPQFEPRLVRSAVKFVFDTHGDARKSASRKLAMETRKASKW
jgi:DNA-binding GntR family transcriptional regulator